MGNFKIGDVVRVLGKPETLRTIVDVPLEYATMSWATSPSRVWLDNGGWIYITELELVDVDDELPPAPESVLYLKEEGQRKLTASMYPQSVGIKIHLEYPGTVKCLGYSMEPDAALQLAHDLRRMAMEIRRKERNG